eukprot:3328-Rhodomonas_salina.1
MPLRNGSTASIYGTAFSIHDHNYCLDMTLLGHAPINNKGRQQDSQQQHRHQEKPAAMLA